MFVRRKITVINPLGIHARPATAIVMLVNKYKSKIKIIELNSKNEAMANSMLSILALGISVNTELEIIADGDDADKVLNDLVELFTNGFNEMSKT